MEANLIVIESRSMAAWDGDEGGLGRGMGSERGKEGGITKGHEETWGDDRYIYYLDYGDGLTGINICHNIKLFI